MKTGLLSKVILLATMFISGYVNAQSLKWYKQHDRERGDKILECKKASDPRSSEDCRNAIDASVRTEGNIIRSKSKAWNFD